MELKSLASSSTLFSVFSQFFHSMCFIFFEKKIYISNVMAENREKKPRNSSTMNCASGETFLPLNCYISRCGKALQKSGIGTIHSFFFLCFCWCCCCRFFFLSSHSHFFYKKYFCAMFEEENELFWTFSLSTQKKITENENGNDFSKKIHFPPSSSSLRSLRCWFVVVRRAKDRKWKNERKNTLAW